MSAQEEIGLSLTRLYRLLVLMGYLTTEEVNWAPHVSNPVNIDRCRELNFDQSAIDLLQLIPWATSATGGTMYPNSVVVDYSNDGQLELSRDPQNVMIEDIEDPQVLDGWMLPLTYGMLHGETLLIDAREGTLRLLNGGPQYDENNYRVPENEKHYLNWPPQPAAPWIDGLIQEFYTLKLLPINYEIIFDFESDIFLHNYYLRRKNTFLAYGWPDQFRLDDWRSDLNALLERWKKEGQEDLRLEDAGSLRAIREL